MMYYIQKPQTWRAANKKCAEVQKFISQFENCLIADDNSRDALIKEIRHKVEELNAAYPRTKKLKVNFSFMSDYISCVPEEKKICDEYVFAFYFYPVKRTYDVLKKGGEINNDERARRYVDGVKKANPIDNPTWGLLETAFVAGMEEQRQMERRRQEMSTCRECKNIHYETLSNKTSDYWNPICLYYNFRTSMNHRACEHFDEAESHI